jgi:peptide/nickel transport system permease protein
MTAPGMSSFDIAAPEPEAARRPVSKSWLTSAGLRRLRPALIPGGFLLLTAILAVLAPVLAPYDPDALNMSAALEEMTAEYPLGTDQLGRDQLSRALYGGRTTLLLSALGTLGIIVIGLAVGLSAGYFGGHYDLVVSTILTVLLALPSLLLSLAILGILGPGSDSLLVALIAAGWASHARVFRASVLSLREQVFVEAAISLGSSSPRILVRHLLPNLWSSIIVLATLDFGTLLLTVSSLSFLGLGVQPPTSDWGVMLNDARPYFSQVPLLMVVPGFCIMSVALASNLLGDAIRDIVDVGRH